jgi:hypothetical protein
MSTLAKHLADIHPKGLRFLDKIPIKKTCGLSNNTSIKHKFQQFISKFIFMRCQPEIRI